MLVVHTLISKQWDIMVKKVKTRCQHVSLFTSLSLLFVWKNCPLSFQLIKQKSLMKRLFWGGKKNPLGSTATKSLINSQNLPKNATCICPSYRMYLSELQKKYLSLRGSGEKPWGFWLATHTMPQGGETMLNEANIKFLRLQKHLYIWPNEGTSRIKCRHRNIYNGIHGNLSVSQHFSINLVCSRGTLPQVAPVLTKYKNRGIGAPWSLTRV